MRQLFWLVLLPAGLAAQRPAVSPVLPRIWTRLPDTTLSAWVFLRPQASLATVSDRIAATGGGVRVRVRSRWLHAISIDAPARALRALSQDRDLRRIQPLGRFRLVQPLSSRYPLEGEPPLLRNPTAGPDSCGVTPGGDPVLGPSEMPYRRLNLRPLTDQGVNGTGVRIGIFDTGFDTQNPAFGGVTVTAQHDFVYGDGVVRNQSSDDSLFSAHSHGTAVWSLFAGDVPGRLRGIARGATYLLAKTEDVRTEKRVEEDNYVAALEWADSIGVDIVSSSLGYLAFDNGFSYSPSQLNGDVAVTTVAADSAVKRGILVVTAAGNSGPGFRTIQTPGDADSVLTIGAEDSLGNIACCSSRGPAADGRIKPDFTAPGVAVCVVVGATVNRLDGTSFATPLLAASTALLKQQQPTLTPIGMRTVLRNMASNRATPDTIRGWGTPDFGAAVVFTAGVTPLAPLPSSGTLTTVTPRFSWTVGSVPASAQPVGYRLRIAKDSALTAPLIDTALAVDTFALQRALKPGSLFWQVDATAATGETATTGIVGPIPVPAWATLTAFNNPAGSVSNTPQPTFTWTSPAVSTPPGLFTYDLGVQRVSNGVYVFGVVGLRDTTFTLPQPLELNTTYRWDLVVHAGSDTTRVRSQGPFLVADGGLPTATLLYQNFPNPFPANGRDATCLWFDVATAGVVELDIVDLRGNPVRRFVPGPDFPAILEAGRYGRGTGSAGICDTRLMWDGRADDGHLLPAGVYLAKLKVPGLLVFKRIVFRGK